jgi:hypothetical protein
MIDIKAETADRLEKQNIPSSITFRLFNLGLINDQTAKRFLIVDTFKTEDPCRGERNHVKDKIADEFCVSTATVHSYVLKK